MDGVFIQLAAILATAFIVSYLIKILKQPLIIGYVVAGILISPVILSFGTSTETIDVLSEFGIAFLLFMVGLHLNPKVIKEVGMPSLIIGVGQIAFSFTIGFLIASQLLSYSIIPSIYIGIALGFSSTIVILKLLSDKKEIDSLHGKLSIGILIIQDFVATFVLIFISSTTGAAEGGFGWQNILNGIGIILLLGFAGKFLIPRFTKGVAKSQELLLLFAVAWCFLVASIFHYLGFSIEIGALLAGIALSISPYSTEISAKIKPLRDFFLIIFFIILGLNIPTDNIGNILGDAIIFALIVIIGNPLIVMFLLKQYKYSKRVNFLVGTIVAQISEFSLIVLLMAKSVGHIGAELVHTLTLTMIISMATSSYLVMYSHQIYNVIRKYLSFFEKKNPKEERKMKGEYDVILFGYKRIGFSVLEALKKLDEKYVVVDFNPEVIESLEEKNIPYIYGDSYDPDLLNELDIENVNLVISTIPDHDTNISLLKTVRAVNKKAIIVTRAHQIEDALELYKRGSDYVLTPHFLGGEYLSKIIESSKTNKKHYSKEREKHIKMLEERMKKGHEHPH